MTAESRRQQVVPAAFNGAVSRLQRHGARCSLYTLVSLARLRPYARSGRRQAWSTRIDVAAGTGEQSLIAADRVGSTGHVLATDISASMLAVTRDLCEARDTSNMETRVMDAQHLDAPNEQFDAAISRFGVMLVPEPPRAVEEIHRVLKSGGRAALMVWSMPERNPFLALPFPILERFGLMPPPQGGQSGPFALGAQEVLEGVARERASSGNMVATATPRAKRMS